MAILRKRPQPGKIPCLICGRIFYSSDRVHYRICRICKQKITKTGRLGFQRISLDSGYQPSSE